MFSPQKCGVSFDPPSIVVYYQVILTGKLHRRAIPVRKFTADSSVSETAQALKDNASHKNYLADVQTKQLEKLLQMIQDRMNGKDPLKKIPTAAKLDQDEDLNKLDDHELNRRKAVMDEQFEKNRIRPGDSNFEYDKDVEFGVGNLESGWDDDDDYSDPEF